MNPWCVLVVCLVMSAGPPVARAEDGEQLRPLDAAAGRALDQGVRESPLFQQLVEELRGTDLIVHVVTSQALPFGTDGTLRFVAAVDGHRYVRIAVNPLLPTEEQVAVLGHELQHACELGRSAARSLQGVRQLYARIGHPVPAQGEAYDTTEATDVGRRVFDELLATRRRVRR